MLTAERQVPGLSELVQVIKVSLLIDFMSSQNVAMVDTRILGKNSKHLTCENKLEVIDDTLYPTDYLFQLQGPSRWPANALFIVHICLQYLCWVPQVQQRQPTTLVLSLDLSYTAHLPIGSLTDYT